MGEREEGKKAEKCLLFSISYLHLQITFWRLTGVPGSVRGTFGGGRGRCYRDTTGLKAQGGWKHRKGDVCACQVGEGVTEGVNLSRAFRTTWNFPVEKETKEHSREGSEKSRSVGAPVRT